MSKSKTTSQDSLACIIFAGKGSIEYIKNKKSTNGLFWSIVDNKYLLLCIKGNNITETFFETYSDLNAYCTKKYPKAVITT